jgi:hypothetical protein
MSNRYLRKPCEVEAIQLDLSTYKLGKGGVLELIVIHDRKFLVLFDSKTIPHVIIPTESGNEMARHKDWVIKDDKNKLSVCKNDLFHENYNRI